MVGRLVKSKKSNEDAVTEKKCERGKVGFEE